LPGVRMRHAALGVCSVGLTTRPRVPGGHDNRHAHRRQPLKVDLNIINLCLCTVQWGAGHRSLPSIAHAADSEYSVYSVSYIYGDYSV
jgi:hypothetical protein